jgi:predicted DNA-binding protein (MmcQ/YjbR family)
VTNRLTIRPDRLARLRAICLALPDATEKGDPPYVGHKGWIGMRLDQRPDWNEVAEVVRRSYRLVAPKRLVANLDDKP